MGRWLRWLACAALLSGCFRSLEPTPPNTGASWSRTTTPIDIRRLNDTIGLERRSSNRNELLWKRGDFQYTTSISFQPKGGEADSIFCQSPGFAQGILCTDLRRRPLLQLEPGCLQGRASVGARTARVEPWRKDGYLVGFLLNFDDIPRVAVDIDHQWEKPLWTQGPWGNDELLDLLTITYFLHDVMALDLENASALGWDGDAPVCGQLVRQLRYPR